MIVTEIKVNDYVRTKAFGIKKVKYFEDEIVIFGHIDGFYSYCWLEEDKNKIVHIKATTLFKKYKDGYKYLETEGGNNEK